jgi:hypothetical protein
MALEIKKVVNVSEVPEELTKDHWIKRNLIETYVEVHIDPSDNEDSVGDWLGNTYPELIEEDSFFIYMDV